MGRVRTLLVLAGALVVAGAFAGSALSFFTVSATDGSAGAAVAGSVSRVTGLALGPGAVTPTASPTVPVTWNAATLGNGGAVTGYVVHRYDAGNGEHPVGGSCSGVPTGSSCSENGVPDGTWAYGVRAKLANWLGAESTRLTVTVDTSAPTITSRPKTVSANSSPSFAFSHPSYTSFRCEIDAASFTPCASPYAPAPLADGSHTFTVEAVDAADVATQTASYTWTVDTAAPTITAKPSAPSASSSPSFGFGDASYGNLECRLDGSAFASCTSPKGFTSLADGSHTFQVRAKDADGVATKVAAYTWTVNTSAPSITAKPSTPSANIAPSFSFSHTAATYAFKCGLDGGGLSACTSPRSLSALSDGSHTFQIVAVDGDGVVTPAASYTWTIGTAAPTLTAQPASLTNQTSATFAFNDGAFSRFTCRLDGATASACDSGAVTYAGPLAGGSHSFTVFATDADGAQTQSRTYVWTIDATPPALQTLQMFDNDHNGKVDRVVATFNESLAACTAPCTSGWTLANVPSGGTLSSVAVSGSTATLNLTEGSGAAATAVGSFTVALAATGGIADVVGNPSSFAAQAPADKAAPVPIAVALTNGGGTIGAGDTASVTFSEPIAVTSVCSTWTGNGSNQSLAANSDVTVTLADNGAANDTLASVTSAANCGGTVHFGVIGLGSASWIAATTTYSGNGGNKSRVDWTAATATLRVTLGTPAAAGGTVSGPVTATYTPDPAISDPAGNAVAGSVAATTKF